MKRPSIFFIREHPCHIGDELGVIQIAGKGNPRVPMNLEALYKRPAMNRHRKLIQYFAAGLRHQALVYNVKPHTYTCRERSHTRK